MLSQLAPLELFLLAVLPWLFVLNIISFIAFAADKEKAERGDMRVPEKDLLQLAAFGGSPAIFFGRGLLRHKTRKEPFVRNLKIIIVLQILFFAIVIFLMSQFS